MADETLLENGGDGARFDPDNKTKTANDNGKIVLNLANRSETLIIDDSTEFIQLRGVFSLFDNFWEFFDYITSDDAERIEDGFGLLVAAAEDGEYGRDALRIDVQNDDGTVANEMRTLVEIALQGAGPGDGEGDINLRIGDYDLGGPDGPYLEVLVDGRNATDVLYISGALAQELLTTVDGFDINTDPVAADDVFNGIESLEITGNVLADNGNGADSDPDSDPLIVVAETITTANGGTVELQADGSFTYTPLVDFDGEDSFTYTLEDGQGGSATGNVSLNVRGFDDIIVDLGGDPDVFRSIIGSDGDTYIETGEGFDALHGDTAGVYQISVGSIELGDDLLVDGGGRTVMYGDGLGISLRNPTSEGIDVRMGNDTLDASRADGGSALFGDVLSFDLTAGDGALLGDSQFVFGDDLIIGNTELVDDPSVPINFFVGDTLSIIASSGLGTTLTTTMGNDTIIGSSADDVISGDVADGNIAIVAGQGTNIFVDGNDRLQGNGGDDTLYGDSVDLDLRGVDSVLTRGADTFVFGTTDGNDTIMDFQQGLDIIEITNDTLSFADLDIREENGNSVIDFDGDQADDHSITLNGVTGLTQDDFVFIA